MPSPQEPTLAEPCDVCPLKRAEQIRADQGEEAAAHYLRVQVSELLHKLGLTRSYIRRLGHDPDVAYQAPKD